MHGNRGGVGLHASKGAPLVPLISSETQEHAEVGRKVMREVRGRGCKAVTQGRGLPGNKKGPSEVCYHDFKGSRLSVTV